jgi:hypothetical protein
VDPNLGTHDFECMIYNYLHSLYIELTDI